MIIDNDIDFTEKVYLKRSPSLILTQRLRKLSCFSYDNKGDDERIKLQRQKPISSDMLRKLNMTTEYGTTVEEKKEDDLEINSNTISDGEFRNKCNKARNLCRKYVYVFFFLEKFAFTVISFCPIFAIFIETESIELSMTGVIVTALLMFIIILINSLGDWGRLREKYARLHHMFRVLANSKAEDRIKRFHSYAISFGSDDLFIDTIVLNDEIYELSDNIH